MKPLLVISIFHIYILLLRLAILWTFCFIFLLCAYKSHLSLWLCILCSHCPIKSELWCFFCNRTLFFSCLTCICGHWTTPMPTAKQLNMLAIRLFTKLVNRSCLLIFNLWKSIVSAATDWEIRLFYFKGQIVHYQHRNYWKNVPY